MAINWQAISQFIHIVHHIRQGFSVDRYDVTTQILILRKGNEILQLAEISATVYKMCTLVNLI